MDGTVIVYSLERGDQPGQFGMWKPNPEDNPSLTSQGGGASNPYNGYIYFQRGSVPQDATEGSADRWILDSPDGSKRTFILAQFPIGKNGKVKRQRPYLASWVDARGHAYTFDYGVIQGTPEFGQMLRANTSNGNFLGFRYNATGNITEAFSNDGRWVGYDYNEFGDLEKVTLPDGKTEEYEYLHVSKDTKLLRKNVVLGAAKHLLVRQRKRDGRVLENGYDEHRRIVQQRSTVGKGLELIRIASFSYDSKKEDRGGYTGSTRWRDANGHTSLYEYEHGLLTKVTDARGSVSTMSWVLKVNDENVPTIVGTDAALPFAAPAGTKAYPRSLWRRTDVRGLVEEVYYTPRGNVAERRSFDGAQTRIQSQIWDEAGGRIRALGLEDEG